jgi:hypothetical protein
LVSQSAEPVVYAHTQELPITMLSIYDTLVSPEIEAQNLFPHLRLPVGVAVPDGAGNYNEVTLPLGQWARITVEGLTAVSATEAERLEWFESAFGEALQKLEDNHGLAISILTKSELEPRDIWQLPLMMEQSGLMELYGGYDVETQTPIGFQRIHDALMLQNRQQKYKFENAATAVSILCVASALILPPTNLATAGTCLMATWFSVDTALQLAGLAAMAETLTYVGIDESLVPRRDAINLRQDANIVALLAVVDVIFGAADILGSARWTQYKVQEVRDGARSRIQPFHLAHGTDQVRVLESAEDVLAALRNTNGPYAVPHRASVVRLYPSSGGLNRTDVLEKVFDEPLVGPLMAESVRRWGMPHFGFRRTSELNVDLGVTPGGGFVHNAVAVLKENQITYEYFGPSFVFVTDYTLLPRGWDPVIVLREELLHAFDGARSGLRNVSLLPGVKVTNDSPLLSEPALAIVHQLAERHGVDPSVLYQNTLAFFKEVRADRVMRAVTPAQSPHATRLEPPRVMSNWLVQHLQSVRERPDGSYQGLPYRHVILDLLNNPDRDALLNTLFPPHLWQDVTARAFWGLPN